MAEVANLVSARNIKLPSINPAYPKSSKVVYYQSFKIRGSSKRNDYSLHASFGFSVDGRILTSFTRKCSSCSSPYCRKVIYVKPGNEAELDSLVQDSIRLATSIKDTCSELCEKSYPTVQYIGGERKASIEKRWSRLLELKNCDNMCI